MQDQSRHSNEHAKWRDMLQPLVTGLVALVAALTLYVQRSDSDRTDTRLTALEIRADMTDKRSDRFGADIDNFKVLLGDIRSDVSFIRGKLENVKGK